MKQTPESPGLLGDPHLRTTTLETRKVGEGTGAGRDRGFSLLCPRFQLSKCGAGRRRRRRVSGFRCSWGSRLPGNGESPALARENPQPGPGRMLGGWKILSPPKTPKRCRQQPVVKGVLCLPRETPGARWQSASFRGSPGHVRAPPRWA